MTHYARQKKAHGTDGVRNTQYNARIVRLYGITRAQWDALFESQGRCCANSECRASSPGKRPWHTDHDHKTKKVRGILCGRCNVSIGLCDDSPSKLRGLAVYLENPPGAKLVTSPSHDFDPSDS